MNIGSAFKSFVAELPNTRKEVVSGLAAAATVVGVLEQVAPHSSVAGWAVVAAAITALSAFLSNPQVIEAISQIASKAKNKSLRALRLRR